MTYKDALERYKKCRNKDAGTPMIGERSTRLIQRGDDFAIRYHNTDVVTIHKNGQYTLNTDGWRTLTSRTRINAYSPASIYQRNGVWLIGREDQASLYYDGMKVNANGNPLKPRKAEHSLKVQTQLSRAISKYIKGFEAHILKNGLSNPSGGDCWDCCMVTDEGKTMGDISKSDHLISHLKEKYYVPSLLWNAIKEHGYNQPEFIWTMIKEYPDRHTYHIQHSLRRYFQKRYHWLRERL